MAAGKARSTPPAGESWQAQAARYALLYDTVLLIARSRSLDELLSQSINTIKWVIDFDRCVLALREPGGDTYRLDTLLETRRGVAPARLEAVPVADGLLGEVMNRGQMRVIDDVERSSPDTPRPQDPAVADGATRSLIALPLNAFGRSIGALLFGAAKPGRFTEEDTKIASQFATHLGLAIDRWQQMDALQREIAERERAEEALRASEQRYSLVTAAAAEGIYDWNVERGELFISQHLSEMFGFTQDDLRADDWNALVHPEDYPAYVAALREHFRGNTDRLECEYRIRTKEDAFRWVRDQGVAVRNDGGRAVRLVGAVSDITEQREAREALALSEQRYALAMEAVGEAVYDWDIDNGRLFFSPGLQEQLGFTGEDIATADDWLDRVHPDDRDRYLDGMRAHFKRQTERFECEFRYRSPGGEWRWARQHGRAMWDEDGHAYRMIGATGDITERKEMALELERAQLRLSTAIEAVSEGFVLWGHDDRIVLFNSRFKEFFIGAPEVVGEGLAFETMIRSIAEAGRIPLGEAGLEAWVARRIESHRNPGAPQELRLANGRWVKISERRTADGGIVGVYTDITELKEREVQLGELVDGLAQARDQAMAATRTKSQFLANMSHELRTPLNAVIGLAEMLREDAEDLGEDGFVEPLDRINRAGKHLLNLINEILDLSKIEAGKIELVSEDFEVAGMVEELATMAQPLAAKNGNALETSCADGLGTMRADLTRVRQVVFNLVSNACKFTENGKVRVEVRRVPAEGGDRIAFRISDTGIGISEEQISRLFQEFSQADASTTRKFGGTGLGLAISQRLCDMMGGGIEVQSAPGEGSTFTATLPADVPDLHVVDEDEGAAVAPRGRAVRGAARRGNRVLVIDDDPTVRDLMQRHLSATGAEVITASDGSEGLRLARERDPAVITLDVLMPGKDGWEVLRELKSDPALADIEVVMVTILDDENKGYALGATEYLTKPVDRERLRDVVGQFLDGGSAARVLIVEDDEPTRTMLRRLLVGEGCLVSEAGNGRLALERIAEHPPDLILLDLMMPEMDGFEFLAELRRDAAAAAIPVVVITSADLSEDDRARLNGGVQKILHKQSFDRDELLEEVRRRVARVVGRRKPAESGDADD